MAGEEHHAPEEAPRSQSLYLQQCQGFSQSDPERHQEKEYKVTLK